MNEKRHLQISAFIITVMVYMEHFIHIHFSYFPNLHYTSWSCYRQYNLLKYALISLALLLGRGHIVNHQAVEGVREVLSCHVQLYNIHSAISSKEGARTNLKGNRYTYHYSLKVTI